MRHLKPNIQLQYANSIPSYSIFNEVLKFPEHQILIERSQEEWHV